MKVPVINTPEAHGTVHFGAFKAGIDCHLYQFSTVEEGVSMGDRCVVGSCAWIGRGTKMGDDVRIQHGAFIARWSVIGNSVFIGPNVTFTDDKYPAVNNPSYEAKPPIIESGVSIGAGAVICPGVTLGHGATIGAGAVVTSDVPPGATVVGIPARVLVSDSE